MTNPFYDVVAGATGTSVVRPAFVKSLTPNELAGANSGQRPDLLHHTYVVYELTTTGELYQSNGSQLVLALELAKLAAAAGNVSPVFVINGTSTIVDANGNVISVGGGGGGTYPEAANYAALPAAPAAGTTYVVLAAQGVQFINRKEAGLYRYSGSAWVYLGPIPEGYFIDNVLTFYDNADPSKQAKLELSGITAGQTRVLYIPDEDGEIALAANVPPAMDAITFDGFLQTNTDYIDARGDILAAQSDADAAQATADGAVSNLNTHIANTGNPHSVTKTQVGLGNVLNVVQEPAITVGTTAQYWRGDKSFQTLDKTAVGLSNVDNTTDAGKPVSTAQQTALNLKANLASPTFTGTVSGITKSMVGLGSVDNTADSTKSVASAAVLTTARTIGGTSFNGSADIAVALATAATALATPRAINGVNFDGSAAITVPAAAGTLTGATLASGVTTSSLTSVGTLTSLTLGGAITGVTDLTTSGNTILGNAVGDTVNFANGSYKLTSTGLSLFGGLAAAVSSAPIQVQAASSANSFTIAGRASDDAAVVFNVVNNAATADKGRMTVSSDNSIVLANGSSATTRLRISPTGQIEAQTLGVGFSTKEGSNAKQGVATLVAGTVTVSNTSVTASSRIFLTIQSLGTVAVPKAIGVTARTAATSFTITSADATDTSVIAYEIFEPS